MSCHHTNSIGHAFRTGPIANRRRAGHVIAPNATPWSTRCWRIVVTVSLEIAMPLVPKSASASSASLSPFGPLARLDLHAETMRTGARRTPRAVKSASSVPKLSARR
jgi:hypothetical protein